LVAPSSALGAAATEFSSGISPGAFLQGTAAGPDGNVWFAEIQGNRIGRITPTGQVTEFSGGLNEPIGITAGPDGNLWFTQFNGSSVGRITPTGAITVFTAGITPGATPTGIAAGPDGNLWFAETGLSRIGRITPAGTVVEFVVGTQPTGITAGPDGNMWFTEWGGNHIGRITPAGTYTFFGTGISPGAKPAAIAAGPDGALWFTEFGGSRIGRITTTGAVTEFSTGITGGSNLASPNAFGITAGPDGQLWFVEYGEERIARISTGGSVTEYSGGITAGSTPTGITAGPDGNLWFSEETARMGRIGTDAPAPAGPNLLRNPGFEDGVRPLAETATTPVPGWVVTPNLTSLAYGTAGGFPSAAAGAEVGGGSAFASGGPNNGESRAIQHVNVSGQSDAIDSGRATGTLSGALGGMSSQADSAMVTATYLNGVGDALGSVQIGPVTPADRGGETKLLSRSQSDQIPSGTRAIRVTAIASRATPSGYNDGYLDNLSLRLDIASPAGPGGGSGGPPAPGAGPDTDPPGFAGVLGLSRRSFRAAGSGASVRSAAAPVGTTVSFRLDEAASVAFTVERALPGRRSGRRCVKLTRRNRRARKCTRYARQSGNFTVQGAAGSTRFRFTGRLRNRKLPVGTYRLAAVARDAAGNKSPAKRSRTFKIVRR
jgi:streptogramin lyase